MTFKDFIHTNDEIAMIITVSEYRSIREKLCDFYSEKHIRDIDDFCEFSFDDEKFLLCNPTFTTAIQTPMTFLSAVVFVDRVAFRNIKFEEA